MKICFSVYSEDIGTGNIVSIYSLWVQTNWSVQEIEEHIDLHDGFRSQIVVGERLSFFDYYCFFDDCDGLIDKIKTIPNNGKKNSTYRTPLAFRVSNFDPDSANAPDYPSDEHCHLYNLTRHECGASGFGEVVYWAAAHPIEMMFIGGIIYDFTKWFGSRVLECVGMKKRTASNPPMLLNTKKLYRNFSKITKIDENDCQITKFHRLRVGVFRVQMRTLTGREYKLSCTASGKIESLEEITKTGSQR